MMAKNIQNKYNKRQSEQYKFVDKLNNNDRKNKAFFQVILPKSEKYSKIRTVVYKSGDRTHNLLPQKLAPILLPNCRYKERLLFALNRMALSVPFYSILWIKKLSSKFFKTLTSWNDEMNHRRSQKLTNIIPYAVISFKNFWGWQKSFFLPERLQFSFFFQTSLIEIYTERL